MVANGEYHAVKQDNCTFVGLNGDIRLRQRACFQHFPERLVVGTGDLMAQEELVAKKKTKTTRKICEKYRYSTSYSGYQKYALDKQHQLARYVYDRVEVSLPQVYHSIVQLQNAGFFSSEDYQRTACIRTEGKMFVLDSFITFGKKCALKYARSYLKFSFVYKYMLVETGYTTH